MALDEKDTSAQQTVTERPVAIHITRNDSLPGAPIEIEVVKEVVVGVGGNPSRPETKQVVGTVPASDVDAAWDGPTNTFKAWVLAIIDNAEF